MKLAYTTLSAKLESFFCKIGCRCDVAKKIVEALLLAEACGVNSHGIRMIPAHAKKILTKDYCVNASCEIEIETSAFSRINCHNQIGMVSATDCMQFAIDKAKKSGVYTVFANNCNTFSAAFCYALQAARQGMLGFVMSNSPAQMAPWGGFSKLLGTNPLAYAVPAKNKNPIIFDMATSVVAKSKINQAKDCGDKIPEGWALDEKGMPTTDSKEAVKGLVLPMSGAKGYGLAMMIDIFAGLISNACYLDGVGRFFGKAGDGMNVGHCFVAINPELVYGPTFYDEIDKYIDRIHSSKSIDGVRVRLPGERKLENLKKCMELGMDVPDSIWKELDILVNDYE